MRRINSVSKTIEKSFIVFFCPYVNKDVNVSIKDNIPLKIDYFYQSFDNIGLYFRCNDATESITTSITTSIEPKVLINFARFAYKNERKKYHSNKEKHDFRY